MTHAYVTDKRALVKRLHRIEGQVRGAVPAAGPSSPPIR